MILNDYNQIINENFDLNDARTRRCIIALEDTEQTQLLSALSSALYDKIVDKVDEIDFGSIPRSRGDITKVDGFENTVECLTIMKNLVMEYKQDPTCVDVVLQAIENVKNRKTLFMKAYALNVEMPMLLYNLIVASIENSVSFLISVCIQYIKDPETGDIAVALDQTAYNNVKQHMIYQQLVSFNNACAGGEIDTSINTVIANSKKVSEAIDFAIEFGEIDPQVKDLNPGGNAIIQEEEPEDTTEINPYMIVPGDDVAPSDEPVNASCVQHEFIQALGTGLALGAGVALITIKGYKFIISVLIPMMRNIVYFFINAKVSFRDNLKMQADFIEMNAYKLQNSDRYVAEPAKMKKVVSKQLKIAEKMKKWANKISIDDKKAQDKAIKDIQKEAKKANIDDIKDNLPADVYTKSVLF